MPVICRSCGKSVSEKLTACYFCGTLLVPPDKCSACGRDVVAGLKACKYCGGAVVPSGASSAAPAAAAKPSPPAAAVPPPKRFEPVPIPREVPQGSGWIDRSETIDLVLLALALPVLAWGFMALALFQMLMVTRGVKFTAFRMIANPRPAATIPTALLALIISWFIYGNRTPASSFWVRWSFPILAVSSIFGIVLMVRRHLEAKRSGGRSNSVPL